jgi:predicted RNA-binding Zn-ribbon protein involved in translation (DUF1610 family)
VAAWVMQQAKPLCDPHAEVRPVEGMWHLHCPQCGEYIKKSDPQKSWACVHCGWQEPNVTYFCDYVHKYCPFSQLASEESRYPVNL